MIREIHINEADDAWASTLVDENRAVSPVIGVVLMVAVTVILSAVIGAFVLGLGSQQQQIPQAGIDFQFDSGSVTVIHQGGDALTSETVDVTVGGSRVGQSALSDPGADGKYTAGEVIYSGSVSSGDEIRVIWQSPSDDTTTTIGRSTAP